MRTDYVVARPLTDDEFERVVAAVSAAASSEQAVDAAVAETFRALLADVGVDWDERSPEVPLRGSDYALPKEQWVSVLVALDRRQRELTGSSAASPLAEWSAWGPTYYRPAAAAASTAS